ncbi:hypothetical protein KKD52_10205 [Myxococcota bacterium]|nr:hypothetical protein [Myxococcota bacterium]
MKRYVFDETQLRAFIHKIFSREFGHEADAVDVVMCAHFAAETAFVTDPEKDKNKKKFTAPRATLTMTDSDTPMTRKGLI